jgi:cytochrome c biogenesis protein CcmG, thiol:disulfide interchange protein DsbE
VTSTSNRSRRRSRGPRRRHRLPHLRRAIGRVQPATWLRAAAAVAVVGGVVALAFLGGDTPEAGVSAEASVTVDGLGLPPFDPSGAADPALGTSAPAVVATGRDGQPTPLAVDGVPTLVLVAAHWCPHCEDELDRVEGALSERVTHGADRSGARVVLLSTWVDRARPGWPPEATYADWPGVLLHDDASSSAADALGLTSTPMWLVLDADGSVLARSGSGATPESLGRILDELGARAGQGA